MSPDLETRAKHLPIVSSNFTSLRPHQFPDWDRGFET